MKINLVIGSAPGTQDPHPGQTCVEAHPGEPCSTCAAEAVEENKSKKTIHELIKTLIKDELKRL